MAILGIVKPTETNVDSVQAFKINASAVAFNILSDKLYSDKFMAIIRELISNGYDSQIANGNPEHPIDVTLPTAFDPIFKVRDYGKGLSVTDVYDVYTTFFSSTKSMTNDYTGCFGLGSKTPFAYTDSFTVISYYEGKKYTYAMALVNGVPSVVNLGDEPTDEPSGLSVFFTVKEGDNFKFHNKLEQYIAYLPNLNINLLPEGRNIKKVEPFHTVDNIRLYDKKIIHYYDDKRLYVKQGQNVYDLVSIYSDAIRDLNFRYILHDVDIVVEVPIGTLDVTPSREQLINSVNNLEKVEHIFSEVRTKVCAEVDNDKIPKKYVSNSYAEHKLRKAIANLIPAKYAYSQSDSRFAYHVYTNGVILNTSSVTFNIKYEAYSAVCLDGYSPIFYEGISLGYCTENDKIVDKPTQVIFTNKAFTTYYRNMIRKQVEQLHENTVVVFIEPDHEKEAEVLKKYITDVSNYLKIPSVEFVDESYVFTKPKADSLKDVSFLNKQCVVSINRCNYPGSFSESGRRTYDYVLNATRDKMSLLCQSKEMNEIQHVLAVLLNTENLSHKEAILGKIAKYVTDNEVTQELIRKGEFILAATAETPLKAICKYSKMRALSWDFLKNLLREYYPYRKYASAIFRDNRSGLHNITDQQQIKRLVFMLEKAGIYKKYELAMNMYIKSIESMFYEKIYPVYLDPQPPVANYKPIATKVNNILNEYQKLCYYYMNRQSNRKGTLPEFVQEIAAKRHRPLAILKSKEDLL